MLQSNLNDEGCVSSAILVVTGSSLDPDFIDGLMELKSDQSWKKDDQKIYSSGRIHTFVDGGWKKLLPESLNQLPILKQVEYWANQLKSKEHAFQEIAKLGYRADIDCFLTNEKGIDFELPPDLLLQLAKNNIGLSFKISFYQ